MIGIVVPIVGPWRSSGAEGMGVVHTPFSLAGLSLVGFLPERTLPLRSGPRPNKIDYNRTAGHSASKDRHNGKDEGSAVELVVLIEAA